MQNLTVVGHLIWKISTSLMHLVLLVMTAIMIFFFIQDKMLSKKKSPKNDQNQQARCSCLPIASNLHPFKIFWHLALYSFAIANPRCPVSTDWMKPAFLKIYALCSVTLLSFFSLQMARSLHIAYYTITWQEKLCCD